MSATGAAAAFNNFSTALEAYLDAAAELQAPARAVLVEQGDVLVQFGVLSRSCVQGLLAGADFAWGSDRTGRSRIRAQLAEVGEALAAALGDPPRPRRPEW